jgi:hypothetical protein
MSAGLEPLDEPTMWVRCTCGVDYVYRRCMSLAKGWVWAWQRDCKNTRNLPAAQHEPRIWTESGEYVATEQPVAS